MSALRQTVLALAALLAVTGCTDGGVPDTDQAQRELRRLYEEARSAAPDDPVAWAKEDLERYGDWEYRIVTLDDDESTEAALNDLGSERWEAYWVEPGGDGLRVFLKRPAKSYLRAVPVGGLRGIFSGDEGGE